METVSFTRQLSVAENVDVLVVGAGPAGICTALEMIKKGRAAFFTQMLFIVLGVLLAIVATGSLHTH